MAKLPEGSRRISVRAQPRAKQISVVEESQDHYKVYLNTPPVDGKANSALIEILSKHFGVPRSRISLVSGQSSRDKIFQIDP